MFDADNASFESRSIPSTQQCLTLVSLHEAVHFPRTELRLRVSEPELCRYLGRAAVRLEESPARESWIGTVLLASGEGRRPSGFEAGTASRLLGHRRTEDGCEIVLRGEFRFAVDREVEGGPCRRAFVRRLGEAPLSDLDPDVLDLRRDLLSCIRSLAAELGGRFDLGPPELEALRSALSFEAMVNHLAANMDVAPRRKQQLLRDELPERARHLLAILRRRLQILDVLRPFRHLASGAELN